VIADAGVLYGAVDVREPRHRDARDVLAGWEGEIVVSAFTAAEADYLILSRLGIDAQLAFVEDLSGAYLVDSLDPSELKLAAEVCRLHRDLELGLADASIVVLAKKWRTRAIATFDYRHFRALAPLQGGAFELHPDS
jgi:uncharacterized protein